MVTVNQTNYVPKQGRKIRGRTVTQYAEYEPFQKTLANLTIAGLNASAKMAMEFYDGNVEEEIDIPLLPRHISPDIVSVHEAAQHFAHQKQLIEERVQSAREKHVEDMKAEARLRAEQALRATGGAGDAPGSPQAKS